MLQSVGPFCCGVSQRTTIICAYLIAEESTKGSAAVNFVREGYLFQHGVLAAAGRIHYRRARRNKGKGQDANGPTKPQKPARFEHLDALDREQGGKD